MLYAPVLCIGVNPSIAVHDGYLQWERVETIARIFRGVVYLVGKLSGKLEVLTFWGSWIYELLRTLLIRNSASKFLEKEDDIGRHRGCFFCGGGYWIVCSKVRELCKDMNYKMNCKKRLFIYIDEKTEQNSLALPSRSAARLFCPLIDLSAPCDVRK